MRRKPNRNTSPFRNRKAFRSIGRTGAHGTQPQKTNYAAAPATPFPMFKPTLKMLNVEAVGHYAIRIEWSDGHNTGIYSFDHLRKICACAECQAR